MTIVYKYFGDRKEERFKLKSNTGTRTKVYKLAISVYWELK